MLSVRFEGHLQDVLGQMREFIGLVTGESRVQVQSVAPAEQATQKPVSPKKVEKIAESQTPPPSQTVVPLDDVKAASVRLAKAKGRQTVVDLLKEFGAQSGADVKEADRAAYIQKADALIPA